ncbi:exodeoxyribonuclease V alpha subunit [Sporomusaceae bacterium BoRhaA]|uniref:SF1B family DNA helicase RecD2 n=1 Tax=Pelorhabdus rhamnosifermentans TaxID=2772457 RepID=UPI001C061980|nr:ATP-dependent RecD-like DNA helicase [Pelorhabdus rhamnosifermentans]MBU2699138.1 exodeoxyribonuclease V alpha subunit [Pelorhabdus rhamnosifermentans]
MEQLKGVVAAITFQSPDGDFTVFKVNSEEKSGTVNVAGRVAAPLLGEQVVLIGRWVEHIKFGRQFQAQSCQRILPTTLAGIERFLGSGAVRGIGPAMAARLVSHFGESVLDVLAADTQRLVEVEGIGAKKAAMIRESYALQSEQREVMLFLEMHGVSGSYAAKICAAYGSEALSVLESDPYRLAKDVAGIGFRTADQIAVSLGFDRNHPSRLEAGVDFALYQTAQAGHSCVPEELLVKETAKLLGADTFEVAFLISNLMKNGSLCVEDWRGTHLIYLYSLYTAERTVASRLLELQSQAKPIDCADIHEAVAQWEKQAELALATAQRAALVGVLEHGILVLTGGPGTGKTTTVRGILELLSAQGFKILLGAPTGRAAKRLSEATGREAMTVHRLLESTGGSKGAPYFARNEDNPLDADAVILDEVSMMDIQLMSHFVQALPTGCRLVLVGDVDQLPAVGPGSVLQDMIRSEAVPVVRLTEVFRQAGESQIVVNAHRINQGLIPQCNSADFQFIEQRNEAEIVREIVALCASELPQDGYDWAREVQVLSPMHRLECGVENLNKQLQAVLNPMTPDKAQIVSDGQLLRSGDKVMQIRNNYEKSVFNGDIGYIEHLDSEKAIVTYPEGTVVYDKSELDELHLAYAMSVHKSQGSEYAVVVMPLTAGHVRMLQRNLLYTAVTRAKEKVILLGTKAALNTAVANDRTRRRYSLLAERLHGEPYE